MNLRRGILPLLGGIAWTAASSVMPMAPAQAAEKVTLCYSSADAVHAPFFYAQEKGYFKKYGLDTTVIFLDSGAKAAQGVIGGTVDICSGDSGSTINADLAGADLRLIAATLSVLSGNVYVTKDIKTPADLKGKRWAISSFGSEAYTSALIALKAFGLTDKDVTLMQIGNQGNRLAALDSGQVQATTLQPPLTTKIEGMGYPVFAEMPKLAPQYASVSDLTSARYIKAHRGAVKNYLKAIAEATADYRKDKTGGVEAIAKYLKSDPKDAANAWDYYAPLMSKDLYVTDASMNFLLQYIDNPKAKTSKPSDFVDDSLVKELHKEGFFDKLK